MVDDRAEGLGKKVTGSIKEAIGNVTGDSTAHTEGSAGKATGAVQSSIGVVKNGTRERSKEQNATMAVDPLDKRPGVVDPAVRAIDADEQRLTLYGEKIEVSHRRVQTALVRATSTTRSREQLVEEELSHERVEVERIPIGRTVDSVPPVRQEGDTMILSVVEEVVVVERRLVLKEEVHVRRVKTTEHHRETVTLREQEATISRTALGAGAAAAASTSDDFHSNSLSNKDPMP